MGPSLFKYFIKCPHVCYGSQLKLNFLQDYSVAFPYIYCVCPAAKIAHFQLRYQTVHITFVKDFRIKTNIEIFPGMKLSKWQVPKNLNFSS